MTKKTTQQTVVALVTELIADGFTVARAFAAVASLSPNYQAVVWDNDALWEMTKEIERRNPSLVISEGGVIMVPNKTYACRFIPWKEQRRAKPKLCLQGTFA